MSDVKIEPHGFEPRHWADPFSCSRCMVAFHFHEDFYGHGRWGDARPLDTSWERKALRREALRRPVAAFRDWRRIRRVMRARAETLVDGAHV